MGYIGSSSGRTTIDYPTYYLGTTWSVLISVSIEVSKMDVVVDYDYLKHATYMSLSYSPLVLLAATTNANIKTLYTSPYSTLFSLVVLVVLVIAAAAPQSNQSQPE